MNSQRVLVTSAKVALLDLNEEAAQKFADEIVAEGGIAKSL